MEECEYCGKRARLHYCDGAMVCVSCGHDELMELAESGEMDFSFYTDEDPIIFL